MYVHISERKSVLSKQLNASSALYDSPEQHNSPTKRFLGGFRRKYVHEYR